MRAKIFTTLLAVSALTALPAAAQTGSFKGSIGGGVTMPVGAIGDSQKTGGHGRITLGYRPLDTHHTWSFEAGWHQLEQITRPEDNLGKVHANVLTFMARYDLDLTPNVYFTGGVGMIRNEYHVRFSYVALTNTDSHAGIAAGIGLNLGKFLFAEGRAMYSMSDPDASIWVPVTVGIRF